MKKVVPFRASGGDIQIICFDSLIFRQQEFFIHSLKESFLFQVNKDKNWLQGETLSYIFKEGALEYFFTTITSLKAELLGGSLTREYKEKFSS